MRLLACETESPETIAAALRREPVGDDASVSQVAASIIAEVRARGDEALLELGRKFDCAGLNQIEVTQAEWETGCEQVEPILRADLELAAANIAAFHEKQVRQSWMDSSGGRVTGQLIRPLARVGIYVPGGTAVYPSSVLMVGIPARVAGVDDIVMCTPCGRDGTVNPLVLFAARLAGVSRIFKVGGAQAVAAMALGTNTIPRVDKIAGPGNSYVNAAKRLLWGSVDMDMLAGPSEVCVVADEFANPAFVALDMLTQAEHDAESAAFLITPSIELANFVMQEIEARLETLPRRDILRKALEQNSAIVVTRSLDEALALADVCAPEHLALMVREPFAALGRIRNAGAILVGDYSPQTLGDYLAGPSHTLPTSGTARFSSPVNVDTFVKKTSVIYYSRSALAGVSDTLVRLARAEGFEAHAEAVRARAKLDVAAL